MCTPVSRLARTGKGACSVGGSETFRWGKSNSSLGYMPNPVREQGSQAWGKELLGLG